MTTLEDFKKAIKLVQEVDKYVDFLADHGVNFTETVVYDGVGFMFDYYLRSNFTEAGRDVIYSWLYEGMAEFPFKAYEDDPMVLSNVDELYEFVSTKEALDKE